MATGSTDADVLATTLRIAKGNVSSSIKQEMAKWTQLSNPKHRFGYTTIASMEVIDMNVSEVESEPRKRQAEMVIELDNTEAMCDASGNLSSGCIIFLIDCTTALTCRLLALHVDSSIKMHVSLDMCATSHAPAPLGSRLQIVGTTTSLDMVIASSIVKIYDKTYGRLVATGLDTKMLPSSQKL